MNFSFALAASVLALCAITVAAHSAPLENPDILATLRPSHPRLLVSASTWDEIKAKRAKTPELDAFLKRQEVEARALLEAPPLVYKKDGRRLLAVSRAALRRVTLLSLQFKISDEKTFLARAQSEMLALSAFSDWNPSHFLDTAEMTAALALGYDWLYADLDLDARKSIETAIADKGLRAGIANPGWMKATNNWNSVCHSGMSLGALAIAETEPDLAAQTLRNAKAFNHLGLEPYAPAGIYPEGASYWGYGTSFQVMLVESLRTALGTDWNLSKSPGFLESAGVLGQTDGPSGLHFNFFDGGEKGGLDSTFFWFAREGKQPALLGAQRAYFQKYAARTDIPRADSQGDRLLPLAAIWWPNFALQNAPKTSEMPRFWLGRGANPLAAFRERWNDPNAMFLALKGGRANLSHGHMDAGSFVFESDGVRWARDLGMQDYLSLESKGIGLWDAKQTGQRWGVFRLNNFSHNTLVINNQLHKVDGKAEITRFSDDEKQAGAIVDLTPVFAGQASKVTRGFSFQSGSHTLIRDEIEGLKAGNMVRFAMLTKAEIKVADDGQSATLSENGKQLRVSLSGIAGAKWETISADPPRDFDAPNPGFHFLIANFTAPASGKIAYSVKLGPGTSRDRVAMLRETELKNWPFAPVK